MKTWLGDAPAIRTGLAQLRACAPTDMPAIRAAMLDALGRGEYDGVEAYQVEHTANRLEADFRACVVATVGDRLAGWVSPVDDELLVLPAFRRQGIGRRLVEAGRAGAAREGRAELRLLVPHRAGPEAFADACGLRHTSSIWQMRLTGGDLATAPRPSFPPTTASRWLRPETDARSLAELVTRVFLDHPSPISLTEAEVHRVNNAPGFDRSTVMVVEERATESLVAFCRIVPFTSAAGVSSGELRMLGVDRAWRGQGLGRAVTAWGIEALRRRGVEQVTLAVEGANENALRLYRSLGFRTGTEWRTWTITASPDRNGDQVPGRSPGDA